MPFAFMCKTGGALLPETMIWYLQSEWLLTVNVSYLYVSLKQNWSDTLKPFFALRRGSAITINKSEKNDKHSVSHSLSLCLSLRASHKHTPSITGCDEGSRPSNESECPFPWQLQILDGQNKEIYHCSCNNWLFLPDYSWPEMAVILQSWLGNWRTATEMGIHLHTINIKGLQETHDVCDFCVLCAWEWEDKKANMVHFLTQ